MALDVIELAQDETDSEWLERSWHENGHSQVKIENEKWIKGFRIKNSKN